MRLLPVLEGRLGFRRKPFHARASFAPRLRYPEEVGPDFRLQPGLGRDTSPRLSPSPSCWICPVPLIIEPGPILSGVDLFNR